MSRYLTVIRRECEDTQVLGTWIERRVRIVRAANPTEAAEKVMAQRALRRPAPDSHPVRQDGNR